MQENIREITKYRLHYRLYKKSYAAYLEKIIIYNEFVDFDTLKQANKVRMEYREYLKKQIRDESGQFIANASKEEIARFRRPRNQSIFLYDIQGIEKIKQKYVYEEKEPIKINKIRSK